MRLIATIQGEPVTELGDGSVTYKAAAMVDTDGSGSLHGDKFGQPDTSLHLNGKALNADEDRYVVVPPIIITSVKSMVLGCQAFLANISNGRSTPAVVGDIGPKRKLGEISVACAKALGIDPSPVSGGEERHVIHYSLIPGKKAVVNGKVYKLQPYEGA